MDKTEGAIWVPVLKAEGGREGGRAGGRGGGGGIREGGGKKKKPLCGGKFLT